MAQLPIPSEDEGVTYGMFDGDVMHRPILGAHAFNLTFSDVLRAATNPYARNSELYLAVCGAVSVASVRVPVPLATIVSASVSTWVVKPSDVALTTPTTTT